jgi:hypothetical protein
MPWAEVRAGRLVGLRGGCGQQLPHHASAAPRRRPVEWGALRALTGWKHWGFSRSQLTAPLAPRFAVQLHARHADPQTTMRYDDNRQDLATRAAASLANVL